MTKPDRQTPVIEPAITLAQWRDEHGYDAETGTYLDEADEERTVIRSHIAWGDTKA